MKTTITYYSAGAGSGKTHKLTSLLNEYIQIGIKPSEIILTTFTDLAASEFRSKAREALIKANRLQSASELDSAAIGTVHAIAYSFVRKYWDYLNISPNSKTISDNNKKAILNQLLTDITTEKTLEKITRYNDFFFSGSNSDNDYIKTINDIVNNCYYLKTDLTESKKKSIEYIENIFNEKKIDVEKLKCFKDLHQHFGGKQSIKNDLNAINYDNLTYNNLIKINNNLRDTASRTITTFKQEEPDFEAIQKAISNAIISEDCREILVDYITVIFDLAQQLIKIYKEKKEKELLIDYDDMELLFLELLKNDKIKEIIKSEYRLILVDEFQDSNPIQVEIFQELSKLIEINIWVGDQKQAIYGFRGTDPQVITEATKEIEINKELDKSWRSRESLVKAANDIFTRSMNDIPKDLVELKPQRDNGKNLSSPIYHWHIEQNNNDRCNAVAQRIKAIVEKKELKVKPKEEEERPIEYCDIAILCRRNEDCGDFISALRKAGVPVASAENEIHQRVEVQLIIALLQYANNKNNKLTKLNIEKLFNNTRTEEFIKRLIASEEEILYDDELFKNLDRVVDSNKHLPVNHLVKNIILELNLHEMVKRWGEEYTRQQNLNNIIALANTYDNESIQNGSGTSISNFLYYLENTPIETKTDNISNTVKVLTYHRSKGLEWPMVILDTLDEDELEENNFIKKEICSVSYKKNEKGVYINIFVPKIITHSSTNIPPKIIEKIKRTDLFTDRYNLTSAEIKRLLYVGFTRARDYVVTISHLKGNSIQPLKWLINTNISDGKTFEKIWGGEIKVKVECFKSQTNEPIKQRYHCVGYTFPEGKSYQPKYVSPSQIKLSSQVEVELISRTFKRIDIYSVNDRIAEIGTCLHNIFAIYDIVPREQFEVKAQSIIYQHNLSNQLPNIESINQSIENLYIYLRDKYGEPINIGHEVPFYHKKGNQIVHGEIDLMWQTQEGCVLVDFKSFPGEIKSILNPESSHYAGLYAPQLQAYKQAIEANGIKLLDSLIYYSVQGNIVRLKI
ncbi:MAG: UvrD-helicase domain-containing protein [Paludibacteraceae bacterium]|nr:UvrD-helicase domain-containing protein [Paludibacteraceae bacterium]